MSPVLFESDLFAERRVKGFTWRLLGILLLAWAVFAALSLYSYNWRDISAYVAPIGRTTGNWLGLAGAWHAYGLLLFCGAGAWVLIPSLLVAGGRMTTGRALRWRPFGIVLAMLSASGLFQMLRGFGTEWAGIEGINIGGNTGGVLGGLLLDTLLEPWLGALGAGFVLFLTLAIGIVILIGPSSLAQTFRLLSGGRRGLRRSILAEDEPQDTGAAKSDRHQVAATSREDRKKADLLSKETKAKAKQEREALREAKRAEKEKTRAARKAEKTAARLKAKEKSDALFDQQLRAVSEKKRASPSKSKAKASEPQTKTPPSSAAASEDAAPPATNYKLPKVDILDDPPPIKHESDDDTQEQAQTIVNTLDQFGIPVKITGVVRGPVITRFEILPAPFIKVNRITGFADNLQMALRALSIRIQTPIPGEGVMGIEVPNPRSRIVTIGEVAQSSAWREACKRMAIPLLLGKDVGGKDLIVDLTKMPHLLIAGSTGSGKSACINAILTGLLLARKPEELRLLMVDPKRVEFTPFTDLPHLVAPVITEAKRVPVSLQWAISEMNRRLKIFSKVGVKNIYDFNHREQAKQTSFLEEEESETVGIPERLPYIVILIDEMADLMLTAQAEIENRIARIAQLSRASGIHMILATQRPSVNVITGTIKANIPGRIAFRVAQKVDSRTILDEMGADALIGRGDMIFLNPEGHSASARKAPGSRMPR